MYTYKDLFNTDFRGFPWDQSVGFPAVCASLRSGEVDSEEFVNFLFATGGSRQSISKVSRLRNGKVGPISPMTLGVFSILVLIRNRGICLRFCGGPGDLLKIGLAGRNAGSCRISVTFQYP